MPDGVVLGIDLGTSATKVIAVDRRLRTHATVELANRLYGDGDRAEQDPAEVLNGR